MLIKWEHNVYNEEFESRDDCISELNNIIDDLEERRGKLKKYLEKDYHEWSNSNSKKIFEETLSESIDNINRTIFKIENYKGDIK